MLENNKNAVTVIYSGGDIQVPFLFFDEDDLVVLYELTPKVLGTDYTVTGAGNEAGGMVLLTVPPANGTRVTVIRKVEFTQLLQIPPNGIIPEGALNRVLDRIVMMIQQLAEQAERAVTYPEGTDKGQVANAGEMLDSIEKARTDINNAVSVAGTTLNTANEKLEEINTTSAAKLKTMQDEVDKAIAQVELAKQEAAKAKAEADKAQVLPVGTEIVGEWRQAPAGCLALFGTRHAKAAFPDLWNHAQSQSLVIPKSDYDSWKSAYGSVGFYAEDVDPAFFWIPLQKEMSTPVIEGIAGSSLGKNALDALPDIQCGFTGGRSSVFSGVAQRSPAYDRTTVSSGGSTCTGIEIKASLGSDVYGRDDTNRVHIRRVHKLYCVKAYDIVVPASTAKMAELVGDIQKNAIDVQKKVGAPNWLDRAEMPITVGLVQLVTRDGFLVSASGMNQICSISMCKADGTTLVTSGYYANPSGTGASFMVPVRKGDYFKVASHSGTNVLIFIGAS